VIFYFFPTTVVRPDVIGGGFFNYAMRVIYNTDNPYNCFPSIHVLNATLVSLFLFSKDKSNNFNAWAIISAVLINLSTMFTKQHVVLDVFAGVILAIIMYMIWSNEKIWDSKWFARIEDTISTENTANDNPNVS
jgi:PAP2 superfamily.